MTRNQFDRNAELKSVHDPVDISVNSRSAQFKFSVHLLGAIFSVGVAFGSGLAYGFSQWVPATNQPELTIQTEVQNISRVKYERLKLGMALAEVEAILGPGIEVSQSTKNASFIWKKGNSSINLTFEGNKLVYKAQSGLN
jgi:hypothetical protein